MNGFGGVSGPIRAFFTTLPSCSMPRSTAPSRSPISQSTSTPGTSGTEIDADFVSSPIGATITRMNNYCDIVMKGGITSGVVYPLAAVELSRHYTFKNVGGTSAGAIAAAAVAAAEHGRSNGKGAGFERLEELPDWFGEELTSVFQPSATTKPLFDIVLAATGGRTKRDKFGALGRP